MSRHPKHLSRRLEMAMPSIPRPSHRTKRQRLTVRTVGPLALLVLLPACGSTVQQTGTAGGVAVGAAAGGSAAELGGPAAGSDGLGGAGSIALPGASGATGASDPTGGVIGEGSGSGSGSGSTSGGVATGPSTTTSNGGTAPGTSGSGAVASGPVGPGITATTIKYGIVAAEDPNGGNNAAGINTANVHNIDQTYGAVINDLNKRGGINGRKVKLVVYRFPNGTTNEELQSRACEKFTKDDRAFIGPGLGEAALTCFEKAGMAMVGGGAGGYGQSQYAKYPHLLDAGAFSLENQAANDIRGFQSAGWLSGWDPLTGTASSAPPQVGIVTYDIPVFKNAVEKFTKPALAAAGVKNVQTFYIRPNLNDGQADAQAAVLKFKREGISHVTFIDNSGGLLELVFATNANSQGYFPRFGCDSGSCNQIVAEQMPQSSLRGAALVGWSPLNDVPASKDFVLPGRTRCEKIMVDADLKPYSRNDLNVMANVCEGVWFFEEAARAAGPSLTADSLVQGAFKAGQSFQSPATFAVQITPTKHAGANASRAANWDPSCGGSGGGCFIYSGPVRRFGS
ncbi:MAG: ABC transporter substrate-binding protein [Actinobacteria bacterium]|nr:ABC transporter substrate-binding protein [Actinomycetota bacterium]MCA1720807.1 ABC transporter substrate-binding protein [Actinomycetota bacterium]